MSKSSIKTKQTCKCCQKKLDDMKHCGACKAVFYCSKECQVANNVFHQKNCAMIQTITTKIKVPVQFYPFAMGSIKTQSRAKEAVFFKKGYEQEPIIMNKKDLWNVVDENFVKLVPPCARIFCFEGKDPFIVCCTPECSAYEHASSNGILFTICLSDLMGDGVWSLFAFQYDNIVRGTGCQSGFGGLLPSKIDPIKSWYAQKKISMDKLINSAIKNKISHPYLSLWQEFVAMWVTADKCIQDALVLWAEDQSIGPFPTDSGLLHDSNVYAQYLFISTS